jgi:hypothetical protein
MAISRNPACWCLITSLLLATIGCKSTDINPGSCRPGRGYADLFTEPKEDVWWQVDVFDTQEQGYKEFTAQFETPQFSIFRVEARPGKHKARIELVNRIVESPVELEVDIREGMITPIRVTMTPAGTSEVRVREDRARWQRSRVRQYGEQMWKLSAKTEPPIPYAPKQSMTYWK